MWNKIHLPWWIRNPSYSFFDNLLQILVSDTTECIVNGFFLWILQGSGDENEVILVFRYLRKLLNERSV